MKSLLFVSLLAFTIADVALPSRAQTPALQQGVSVQMAMTNHAQPVPAADDQDAWVIAVTADGKLYFGAHPETSEGLLEKMKSTPGVATRTSTSKPMLARPTLMSRRLFRRLGSADLTHPCC